LAISQAIGDKDEVCMKSWLTVSLLFLVLFLAGCNQPDDLAGPAAAVPDGSIATPLPAVTRLLPTLYPTASPQPTASATPPVTRPATAVPDTPVAFDRPVVVLTYRIPALGLDRRLTGNLASQIEAIDEVTGQTVARQNQAGILLELQQALSALELSELPEECDFCVQLSYELPLSEISAEGWLEDVQFLASIENYMAALLGPHFPPDTVAGLRRSATPYYPAHTVAQTSTNFLWRWTAVEAELSAPETASLLAPSLPASLTQLDITSLRTAYQAPCPEGSGIESLYLANDSGSQAIRLICPSLSLPADLVPIYVALQELADAAVADEQAEPAPEPAMPLESLLLYRQADGQELNLFLDGRATLKVSSDQVLTTTLNVSQVLTLTTALAESGLVRPGVERFVAGEGGSFLVVRGPDGVYEAAWDETPASGLEQFITLLEDLITRLLDDEAGPTPTPEPDETPADETPTAIGTPAADETPVPGETPTGTAEP
jgi:hypothetical protein